METLSAIRNNEPTTNANAVRVDMKLEVVIISVSDVDRAKEFCVHEGAPFVGHDGNNHNLLPEGRPLIMRFRSCQNHMFFASRILFSRDPAAGASEASILKIHGILY